MPIVKLEKQDSYLIGTEAKQMTVKGNNCMVRVGGGYVTIQEYYDRYSSKQCVSLYHIMNTESTSFVDSITNLLKTHGANQNVIDAYQGEHENMQNSNALFLLLATFLEEKLNSSNKKSP